MSDELDNICEECKKEDESVSQNLIKHSYKICNSCYSSKQFFLFKLVQKFLTKLLKQSLELRNR